MSLLGFDAVGRLAVGQLPRSASIVLPAAAGTFALTGTSAAFTITEAAAVGAFALTGIAATFKTTFNSPAAGAFAFTGKAAALNPSLAPVSGSFAFTGKAANETFLVPEAPGNFTVTFPETLLTRTGDNFDLVYGGVGHLLYEQEMARKLAAITRNPPRPVDRRTAPQFQPFPRPYSAPIAPAPDVAAIQNQRMAAQVAAVQASKKRQELEAILLLAS